METGATKWTVQKERQAKKNNNVRTQYECRGDIMYTARRTRRKKTKIKMNDGRETRKVSLVAFFYNIHTIGSTDRQIDRSKVCVWVRECDPKEGRQRGKEMWVRKTERDRQTDRLGEAEPEIEIRCTHRQVYDTSTLNESINDCTYSMYQLSICRLYLAWAWNFSCPFRLMFYGCLIPISFGFVEGRVEGVCGGDGWMAGKFAFGCCWTNKVKKSCVARPLSLARVSLQ